MAKRVLVTGASGLLGRECLKAFADDPEWTSLGLAFSRSSGGLKKVNLTDPAETAAAVREFKPSVILHSAAERRPDVVEKDPEKTNKINVESTENLCQLASELGAYVIFISTDYVFDGTKPPYKPGDPTCPLNKYGQSKADGEKVVLKANPDNIVFRVPVLYGEVERLDESAVTILFSKVKDTSKPAEMNHCERRYPTFCADLGRAIKVLANSRAKDPTLTGEFHWSGDEMLTKYDMAVIMAELFGLPTSHIVADTKPAVGVPRPFDCHLDCGRMDALGVVKRTPFREGIKSCLEKYFP
ncbi:methionine adenosyltransferase 2 subunit beta-like [Elysia marginata]|uniref:Methionine adenosyltransferase 2 subunit beta n=1 Tax=Elysia marginata TaxID=1093978 RepID=A0AAV4H4K9_9GAST|nr:methionine adenosyltransferase 2 subunit beta-like [Elysia marginata]